LPQRPNCAAFSYGFRGTPRAQQARDSNFYHSLRDCLQLFRGSKKIISGAVN